MGMAAILFYGAEPFEQIDNIPSRRPNLVKIGQAISQEKTFKRLQDFIHVYRPGARADNSGGQNFDCN